MDKTYDNYMARMRLLLEVIPAATALLCGVNLGAVLIDGIPICFDLDAGLDWAGEFDSSAWNGQAWDGETIDQTWGVFDPPIYFCIYTGPFSATQ